MTGHISPEREHYFVTPYHSIKTACILRRMGARLLQKVGNLFQRRLALKGALKTPCLSADVRLHCSAQLSSLSTYRLRAAGSFLPIIVKLARRRCLV